MPEGPFGDRGRVNAFGNNPGPRDWSPVSDPFGLPLVPPRRRAARVIVYASLAVIVLGVVTIVGVAASRAHPGPTSGSILLETDAPGIDSATAAGSCLTAAAPDRADFVSCTSPHRYEVVGHLRATGKTFPTDDYWNGPIAQQCFAQSVAYVAQPRDTWPDGLETSWFEPTETGWAGGDRDVSCLVKWTVDVARSAKNLPPAADPSSAVTPAPGTTPAVPPSNAEQAPAAPAQQALSGRLVRVVDPNGYAGCLGLAVGPDTYVVAPEGRDYAWTVSVDDTGRTDDPRSGIVLGSDPQSGAFVAHTGSTVRLTGSWQEFPAAAYCGATRVFLFRSVG